MVTFLHRTARRVIAAVEKQYMDGTAEFHPENFLNDPLVFTYGDGKILAANTAVITDTNVRGTLIVEDDCVVSGVHVRENTVVILKKGSRVVNALFGDLSGADTCIEIGDNSNVSSVYIPSSRCTIGKDAVLLHGVIRGNSVTIEAGCMLLDFDIESDTLKVGKDLTMLGAALNVNCSAVCVIGDSACMVLQYMIDKEDIKRKAAYLIDNVKAGVAYNGFDSSNRINCQLAAKTALVGSNCLFATGFKIEAINRIHIGDSTKVVMIEGYQKPRENIVGFSLRSGEILIGRENMLIANRYYGESFSALGDDTLSCFSCVHTGAGATILCQLDLGVRADCSYVGSFRTGKKRRFQGYPHFTTICRIKVNPGNTIVV